MIIEMVTASSTQAGFEAHCPYVLCVCMISIESYTSRIASYFQLTCMIIEWLPPAALKLALKLIAPVFENWVHILLTSADESIPYKYAGVSIARSKPAIAAVSLKSSTLLSAVGVTFETSILNGPPMPSCSVMGFAPTPARRVIKSRSTNLRGHLRKGILTVAILWATIRLKE
jgi:hypothetical protein